MGVPGLQDQLLTIAEPNRFRIVELLGRGPRPDGEIVTAGGRVLCVTGLGASPGEARDRAYSGAQRIEFDGRQLRTDIAARAVDRVGA